MADAGRPIGAGLRIEGMLSSFETLHHCGGGLPPQLFPDRRELPRHAARQPRHPARSADVALRHLQPGPSAHCGHLWERTSSARQPLGPPRSCIENRRAINPQVPLSHQRDGLERTSLTGVGARRSQSRCVHAASVSTFRSAEPDDEGLSTSSATAPRLHGRSRVASTAAPWHARSPQARSAAAAPEWVRALHDQDRVTASLGSRRYGPKAGSVAVTGVGGGIREFLTASAAALTVIRLEVGTY